ncbi:putative spermidine putrescine import atp-binding protein pota protein [Eutypa lata UCREL1]|uniref:Putative spermidine putrescine import atp-binding protein pota protein n=1 Tax=Eutypa lata (strain UCR-EL1) TaxID=1287681 RepID=M7SYY9_EUTLA|nr:putative spermidine putrescine import atp-binding protein pota protein [Eutypa lata UCREL1]
MIAHRLSTVKKADNIIVLAKGKVVQWGNHTSLMATAGGPYWLLVNSQQLEMDEADQHEDSPGVSEHEKRTIDLMTLDKDQVETRGSEGTETEEAEYQPKGLFRSFGTLLLDQKPHWYWYAIMLLGSLITGGKAYLLAAIISSFGLQKEYLTITTNFWCLMFVVLACGAGIGYFCLGFAATRVSFNVASTYQREYFQGIISKTISWFDGEGRSIGALAGLLANDPVQLHQLLGVNMAFVATSVFSVTGCLIIAFYFGWKLTLVALASAMPLAMAAGFFRVRIEKAFEKMNVEVFSTSAKWATESIAANRTVTALTMEQLVVYIAVIQGAIGAGHWLSFIPSKVL